jgi:drug/metabolite transporter (DMT)-like permease
MAGVAAVFAAVLGFVGAIFLCGELLSGEMTEWGLILAPTTALIFGIGVFVLVFRKIEKYGEDPDSQR